MASVPSENGKEDSLCSATPNTSSEPSDGHPSTGMPESRQMQDIPLQSPPLVTPLASAFPPMGSTGLSLPYIPTFSAQHCISPEVKVVLNGNGLVAEGELDVEEDKKRDKEHKKRSKNWTRPETLKLIRLRTELAPRFARTGRKSELWDQIAVALQEEHFLRDAQQCRDKWEKLMAGYKEVRDGLKEREDNPFYEELHPLLSGKSSRRDRESLLFQQDNDNEGGAQQPTSSGVVKDTEKEGPPRACLKKEGGTEEEDDGLEERISLRKRKRGAKYVAVTDLHAVQALLETVISRQQKLFREFLDAMERKEQLREQMRQEREEKWRAEERAQRCVFNNAMLVLTQKLVGEKVGGTSGLSAPLVCNPMGHQGPMKRSKNWKRAEVLQLIKLRGEMESKFSKSTRRAALWDEVAEVLGTQGIKRDGKQCREKWDKLMSEHKDVLDGKREQGDSPYFTELTAVVGGRPGEAG